MKELSPLAKQLVEVGRTAQRPSDADKQRNYQALQQRLLNSPQPPADPSVHPKPSLPPSTPWPLISAVTVGAGILAGALYFGLSTEAGPTPPAAPPVATAAKPAEAAPLARTPAPPTEAAASPTADDGSAATVREKTASPKAKASAESQPKRQLAEEVALLSRATSALNAGRAQAALNTLAEHQQKFPRGLLSVERRAARAQALCMLGRKAEAERELSRLSPTSPQAARARQLCGGK